MRAVRSPSQGQQPTKQQCGQPLHYDDRRTPQDTRQKGNNRRMKTFYINYDEKATINYHFVFALYCIAETDKKERIGNIITYKSQKALAERIKAVCNYNISVSTISRIL